MTIGFLIYSETAPKEVIETMASLKVNDRIREDAGVLFETAVRVRERAPKSAGGPDDISLGRILHAG